MGHKITMAIDVETYARLQERARGGVFSEPPVYRNGKMLIEVSDAVANAIHKMIREHNLKTVDQAIMWALDRNP